MFALGFLAWEGARILCTTIAENAAVMEELLNLHAVARRLIQLLALVCSYSGVVDVAGAIPAGHTKLGLPAP